MLGEAVHNPIKREDEENMVDLNVSLRNEFVTLIKDHLIALLLL